MITLEGLLMMIVLPCATACVPCLMLAFLRQDPRLALLGFGAGVVANGLTAIVLLLEGQLASASISAVLAIGCAMGWWSFWRRRRRDRARRSLGAKSRARLAALVAKVRESGKRRPVLRPVPGGAR